MKSACCSLLAANWFNATTWLVRSTTTSQQTVVDESSYSISDSPSSCLQACASAASPCGTDQHRCTASGLLDAQGKAFPKVPPHLKLPRHMAALLFPKPLEIGKQASTAANMLNPSRSLQEQQEHIGSTTIRRRMHPPVGQQPGGAKIKFRVFEIATSLHLDSYNRNVMIGL